MMLSNGQSFSAGQDDTARYPEPQVFRFMRPVPGRGQTWG
jgi:hypothetical protein